MKRIQRKANFNKVQLSKLNDEDTISMERRQTRSTKPMKAAAGLSAHENNKPLSAKETAEKSPFAKRVNLTRFLYKDKSDIPKEITKPEVDSSDDFETPVKKIKTAPKFGQRAQPAHTKSRANTRKRSKQPNIKSALLRTEQMFSEIAAQHCIADNFSPDDIQMALVISRSEVDKGNVGAANMNANNTIETFETNEKCAEPVEEDIYSRLQKYGFRTAAKADYANCFAAAFAHRRGKTKWANKFTALTLRNPEVQTKKLNDKIEAMLARQYTWHKLSNKAADIEMFESYKVRSNFLLKHLKATPDAHFFRNVESFTLTEQLERFFIQELFPVTHLSAGHLLKDWTIVPGRDVSPERRQRKRLSVQEKKFEKFYKELAQKSLQMENIENIATAVDNVEPNDNVSMLAMPGSQTNCGSENELDGLLEVIAATDKNEFNEGDNIVADSEKNKTTTPSPIDITSSSETNNTDSGLIVTNTQTRCTSPDLFADYDSDREELVEQNNLNNITTFENFSSDEVKTCLNAGNSSTESLSMKAPEVVDLTQNIVVEEIVEVEIPAAVEISTLCEKENASEEKCLFPTINNTQKKASMDLENNDALTADHIMNNSKDPIAAIDLTQSDDELCKGNNDNETFEESDSDCILLSDDEINYSILKANKVDDNKSRILSRHFSAASSCGNLSEVNENTHNFSVLEFVEDVSCFDDSQNGALCKKQTFDLSGDAEPIKAHYLSMAVDDETAPITINENLKQCDSQKSVSSSDTEIVTFPAPPCQNTPIKQSCIRDLLKAQRAEFGILESQSEPFSQTPPHWQYTPVKSNISTSKDESPIFTAEDTAAPTKRSSEKFNSFLQMSRDLGVQPLGDYDDFDEFDRLVYGSPPPKSSIDAKVIEEGVPAGLSQLLTGEISFNVPISLSANVSPKCQRKTNEICTIKTPEKSEKPEEITINEHVYLVRRTCTPKPNFETQSESEILKQLYEFGIKPLKRRQAIKLLEYIYNETHPLIVTPNTENSTTAMESQLISKSTLTCNSDSLAQSQNIGSKSTQSSLVANKFNFQDCLGTVLLRFSQELFAEMRNDEEIYIFQTNVTKKTPQPLVPLHVAWFNLVLSSQKLHESILTYEPIELQEVYLFFKSLGYRYDPKDLKSFFDRRCIIFRYDLTAPEKQKDRHTRKPQKNFKRKTKI